MSNQIQAERAFWEELRRREHERRAAILGTVRRHFSSLSTQICNDEPKHNPAFRIFGKANSALSKVRFMLEDIAAKEFGGRFALDTFAIAGGLRRTRAAEDDGQPDDWLDNDRCWSPAVAQRITRISREKLLEAARAGKFKSRAARSGLQYDSRGVIRWAAEIQKAAMAGTGVRQMEAVSR
jgi:hypothetical protein